MRLIREVANMTPKGIYLQIRIPEYKNLIPKADPIFSRLGYHNDSLFGTVTGSQAGLGTGNVDVGKPDCDQAVSYTHLDVYKRQPMLLVLTSPLLRSLPPRGAWIEIWMYFPH